MSQMFSSLNPNHKLFRNLVDRKPIWWQNLLNNPNIYIEVRKDNYLDVYYNGGRVLNLTFTDKFKGKIHYEYIPLKSKEDYVPLEMTDDSVSIAKDFIKPLGINNFAGSELKTIQKRIEKSYPASSEKGIQSSFVLNNKLFLDTEFQHKNNIRFDLIWADIGLKKLFVIELKTIEDQRIFIGEKSKDNVNYNKIDKQLKDYRDFVVKYRQELLSHYFRVFAVKKMLSILRPGLEPLDSLEGFTFEERPILLIGDCTQGWINRHEEKLDKAIKDIAYGCFYQGKSTRAFFIPEKTKGNKHVFV